jgi:hypothetical protein
LIVEIRGEQVYMRGIPQATKHLKNAGMELPLGRDDLMSAGQQVCQNIQISRDMTGTKHDMMVLAPNQNFLYKLIKCV